MSLRWLRGLVSPSGSLPSRRDRRIDAEIAMIAERYSRPPYRGIRYDDQDRHWLIIPNYPLPSRLRERSCDLLVVFPPTYPETPPVGFYTSRPLHPRHGDLDPHATVRAYYDAPDLTAQGWCWYCVLMNMRSPGAWRPQPDHTKPDNLWTFLAMVREALTNDA